MRKTLFSFTTGLILSFSQPAFGKVVAFTVQPSANQSIRMDSGSQIIESDTNNSTVIMHSPEPSSGKRIEIFFYIFNKSNGSFDIGPENFHSNNILVIPYDQLMKEQKSREASDKVSVALQVLSNSLSANANAGYRTGRASFGGYVDCGIRCGGNFSGSATTRTYDPNLALQDKAQLEAINNAKVDAVLADHASSRQSIARNLRTTTLTPGRGLGGILTFELPRQLRKSKVPQPFTIYINAGGQAHLLAGYVGPVGVAPPLSNYAAIKSKNSVHELPATAVPKSASPPSGQMDANLVNSEELFYAGLKFATGFGASRNDEEAVRLFKLAADKGLASAQHYLGYMYSEGRGVTRNDAEALRLFRLAANQNNIEAQLSLAFAYLEGRGVPQDDREAVRYYRLAAEQGSVGARGTLGAMLAAGRGTPVDYREAVKWLTLAANMNDVTAQYNLALAYEKGLGVTQDYQEAARLYQLAATEGNAKAQYKLALMYRAGRGIPQNGETAMKLLKLAAAQGHEQAAALIGP